MFEDYLYGNDLVEKAEIYYFEKTLRDFYIERSVCVDFIFGVVDI